MCVCGVSPQPNKEVPHGRGEREREKETKKGFLAASQAALSRPSTPPYSRAIWVLVEGARRGRKRFFGGEVEKEKPEQCFCLHHGHGDGEGGATIQLTTEFGFACHEERLPYSTKEERKREILPSSCFFAGGRIRKSRVGGYLYNIHTTST